MITYYTILFAPIRFSIDEKLSIGLFLFNENEIIFNYSKEKLKSIKRLKNEDSYQFIKKIIIDINQYLNKLSSSKNGLYPLNHSIDFNKLFAQQNNTLTFTEPKEIDLELTQINYNLLFNKFINNESVKQLEIEYQKRIMEIIKTILKDKVNYDLNPKNISLFDNIPKSFLPSNLDISGKNELPMTGQIIDFNKKSNILKNELKSIFLFTQYVGSGYHFILGDPPIKNQDNQIFYREANNFNNISLITSNEVENKLLKTIVDHNISPLV